MWKKLAVAGLLFCQSPLSLDYIPPASESPLKLFSGSCSTELASEVAGILGVQLGRVQLGKHADGETNVKVLEDVSDKDVYIISSMGSPVQDNIMELLLLLSSLKRASCRKIFLIIPYLAYNRQDLPSPGSFFTPAEDIPKLIESQYPDMVIGVDFHGEHIDGNFTSPVYEIEPYSVAVNYLKRKALMHPVVMSPDVRATPRAYKFYKMMQAQGIQCDFALLPNPGGSLAYIGGESTYVGDRLTGRDVIIVDDMVITGGSLLKCVDTVRKMDAEKIYCFATHPVLSQGSVQRINQSSITEYICTNSLPVYEKSSKIMQLSIAGLIAAKIVEIFDSS